MTGELIGPRSESTSTPPPGTGVRSRPARLLARSRDAARDPTDHLNVICASLVELDMADAVGICEHIGVSQISTLASTDPRVDAADALQHALAEGPAIGAGYLDEVLSSEDISTDGRWPLWSAAVKGLGFASLISVRLYSHHETSGILTLYFTAPRNITDDDREIATVAGIHASIELKHQRHKSDLWRTIDARHQIGQAQGLLMERMGIDAETAFAILRRTSQSTNTKLRNVAEHLLTTRVLPGPVQHTADT